MSRSATTWHKTVDNHGRTILYITSDECTVNGVGICSIYDPMSDEPSYRLLEDGERRPMNPHTDAPYPEHGLVVLGTSKFNRPTLTEVCALTGLRGKAAALAVEAAIAAGA